MPDDLAIQRLADRLDGSIRDTFVSIVTALAAGPSATELDRLIENEDIMGIIRLWEATLRSSIVISSAQMESSLTEVVRRAAATTITIGQFAGSLTRLSDNAYNWLHNESSRLITGISTESMLSIRGILSASYQSGTAVRPTARLLRSVVGLLPRHARAVTNYANELNARGFSPERIDNYVATYSRRLVAYRADMISRTEAMTAAHVGQLAAWENLLEIGLIQRHRVWREWITATDDRVCPLCAPMDGQRVRLGDSFISDRRGFPEGFPGDIPSPGADRLRKGPLKPDPFSVQRHRGRQYKGKNLDGFTVPLRTVQSLLYPPLHPSCRCTLRLVFDGTVS